jgi:adenosyl cobinamide kinase/adenosyl cobinamide phosphate guanylyltransferase
MITLVLGGARSGKSAVAEALTAALAPPVTYVATMVPAGDPALEARVAAHRRRRDPAWTTADAGEDLVKVLTSLSGTVLVDSLGPWIAGRPAMDADERALCEALRGRVGDTVIVSDEVGMSVHPSTPEGHRFQDALGALNLAVASVADRVYLVVAGRTLELPGRPDVPHMPDMRSVNPE